MPMPDWSPDEPTGEWPAVPTGPAAEYREPEPDPDDPFPAGLWLAFVLTAAAVACGLAWLACEYKRLHP